MGQGNLRLFILQTTLGESLRAARAVKLSATLLAVFLLAGLSPSAATATAVVSATANMTSVNRIGVNMGNQSQYSESDFMQNMLDNPGFEFGQECWVWIANSGATSSGFSTTHDNGEVTGFWNGASASVRAGVSAGQTFTVGSFTSGGTFTCSGNCPTLNANDVVSACVSGNNVAMLTTSEGGWGLGSDGNISLSAAQKYEGNSSMAYNVSGGGSESATFGWDTDFPIGGVCSDHLTACTAANQATDCASPLSGICSLAPYTNSGPWHPVVGNFEISLYALASGTSGGTPTVSVSLVRSGGTGTNVSHTFNLTNDGAWHQYTYTFTGTDTVASAKGVLSYTQTASNGTAESGATIYVDDVYLGRNESSTTGFRDEVITSLQTLNPGSLRYMIPYTLDQNDANFEGSAGCTPGAVGISGYTGGGCDYQKGPSSTYTGSGSFQWGWFYASQDIYALANNLSAAPWFSIPNTFSDADLQQFAKNACAAMSTYNTPSIWIEQSNEDWNGAGPGAKFAAQGEYYGEVAGRNFHVLSTQATATCPSYASRIHYVIGNQSCNSGVIDAALAGATAAGFSIPNTSQYGSDDATYNSGGTTFAGVLPNYGGSLSSQATSYALWFQEFPPDYLFKPIASGGNCVPYDQTAIGSNNTMSAYESGVGAGSGPGVGTTEQSYLSQAGFPSAMWMPEDWLFGTQSFMPIQNAFTFAQVEYGANPSYQNPEWGIIHDLDANFGSTFPHIRPVGLGLSVINSAMQSGGYFQVTGAPSGVYANAFNSNTTGTGNWSAALVNSTGTPVQVQVQFPSGGTLPTSAQTVLYTNGITDNNEDSNSVKIGALPGGISASGNTVTLTLPPFSVVALTQGGGSSSSITPESFTAVSSYSLTANWRSTLPAGTIYTAQLSTGTFPNTFLGNLSSATVNAFAIFSGLSVSTTYYGQVSTNAVTGPWTGLEYTVTLAPTDATPPTVAITAPANNATVSGTVTLSGTAADNVAVANVAVAIDSGVYASAQGTTNWTFSFNTASLTNSTHTITAKATDTAGNTATNAITITVSNSHTSVNLIGEPDFATSGDYIFSIKIDTALEPNLPINLGSISLGITLPASGAKTFTLAPWTQDTTIYYEKVASTTIAAADLFDIQGTSFSLSYGAKTIAAIGEAGMVDPSMGGVIFDSTTDSSGEAQITIAAGEITQGAQIFIDPLPADTGQNAALNKQNLKSLDIGRDIIFSSSGTLTQATLTLPFNLGEIPSYLTPNDVQIAYYNPLAQQWQIVGNITPVTGNSVSVKVNHFSLYMPVLSLPTTTPGLIGAYAFPSPATGGNDPTIRVCLGVVNNISVTIFDVSGRVVNSGTVGEAPTVLSGTTNSPCTGQYVYDYLWTGRKASGVYFAVIHGHTADGSTVKAQVKFAIVK